MSVADESLIATLSALRDTYAQRQRAAASLMTALKATTVTLGKAGRLLGDYASSGGVDDNRLAQARRSFADVRVRDEAVTPLTPELRREVKALSGVAAALREALTALRAEPVDVVRLGRSMPSLRDATRDPDLAALLPSLESELEEAQRALGDTFGYALRGALAAQGIELGGRPPRFSIGRFELAADFVGQTAALSYGKHLLARRVPLSLEAVLKAYQREAAAVTGRAEDGARWMGQFYEAWESARARRDRSDQRANVVECYFELVLLRQSRAFRTAPTKGAFTEYSRAQFAYDLYEFGQNQQRVHKGWRMQAHGATKSQTDNPERSLWIVDGHGPHDGRYIGDIVFSQDA